MLDFYHDLGMIVKHRNTVVLRAQWLIDVFKQLITVRSFSDMVRDKREFHNDSYSCLNRKLLCEA